MRKIVTGLFMSLDGVVEADNDWQFVYFDEELFEGITAGWDRADAALIRRRSFEGYEALRFEYPDSPMVAFLERVHRYVASTTLAQTSWRGSTVISGDVHEQLSQLKQRPGKEQFPDPSRPSAAGSDCDELDPGPTWVGDTVAAQRFGSPAAAGTDDRAGPRGAPADVCYGRRGAADRLRTSKPRTRWSSRLD